MAKNKTALAVNPTVTAELGVRNEDLISVAVAQRERALNTALNGAQKESRSLREEQIVLEKRHSAALHAAGTAHFSEKVAALEAAFGGLGSDLKVSLYLDNGVYGGCDGEWKDVTATVAILSKHSNPNGYTGSPATEVCKRVVVPATEELLSVAAALRDNRKDQMQKMEVIHTLKEEIRNIASTERQARAALAEATLRGTETGRELLEAMTGMSGLMTVPSIGMVLEAEVK